MGWWCENWCWEAFLWGTLVTRVFLSDNLEGKHVDQSSKALLDMARESICRKKKDRYGELNRDLLRALH